MSLPHATQQQIADMNKIAAEKYNIVDEQQQEQSMHPQLQQAIPEEADIPVEEVVDQEHQEVVEDTSTKMRSNANSENLRIIRERAARANELEKERDELMRQLMSLQQQPQTRQVKQELQEVEESLDDMHLDPDALVEGKHVSKFAKKINALESKLKQYERQTETQIAETRIRSEFPDFEKVASIENLKTLRALNPELAEVILSTPDQYKQASLAYKMVKQLGIYQEDTYIADKARALNNINKPRPVASVGAQQGDSPLTKANAFANGLTDELKQQLHREMLAAMKAR